MFGQRHVEVRITGLQFSGFAAAGQATPQYSADIVGTVDCSDLVADRLDTTVNYTDLSDLLVRTAEGQPFNIMETLASTYCKAALERFSGLTLIQVELRRASAHADLGAESVGVRVQMQRSRAWGLEDR